MLVKMIKARIRGTTTSKHKNELAFWKKELLKYIKWYNGQLKVLYSTPCPTEHEKVQAPNVKDSSMLTWHKLHQEAKYLKDLELDHFSFKGTSVLDIGSGPIPSATCFMECELYCLDPMLPEYLRVGFPVHYYDNVRFVHGYAEDIPLEDGSMGAVISVNAMDHVDDFAKTAREIRRVLKPGGLLRMHIHYHAPTRCEPIQINDDVFADHFGWCPNLRRVRIAQASYSARVSDGDAFALWSNF
ncbi:class I SAM-dependent methyltransferase [Thermodesulfobacteriota bacterium]